MKHLFWQILSRFSLILLGLVSGLIILEVALRIIYPDPSPKLVNQGLQLHRDYGISFTPDAAGWNTSLRGEYSVYININQKGLRGAEYPYDKPTGVYRVLVLGDSFTSALQVTEDETFSALMASQLNQTSEVSHVEVINAGVVGYGTTNELAYFTREGYKYQPDLVILALFVGNDISDNMHPPHYKLENGTLIPLPPAYSPDFGTPPWAKKGTFFKNLRNFLYLHSRLYSVTVELLVYTIVKQFPPLAQTLTALGLVEITRPVMNAGNIYSTSPSSEEAWQMTEALILKLRQEVESRQAKLLVVILPDETEVDVKKWAKLVAEYPDLFAQQTSPLKPTARLAQILQSHQIAHVQLSPILQAYQDQHPQESLYYKFDGHWKPNGHRLAAQAMYDYMVAESVIKAKK